MFLHGLRQRHRLGLVVDRDDNHLGSRGAGRMQELESRGVAVEYLDAESAHDFHLRGVEIEDGRAAAVGAEQPADDVAEPAEAPR